MDKDFNLKVVYAEVEVREYKRVSIETGVEEIVKISNRNNLPVEEHLRLLNLNDERYIYSEVEQK